MSKYITSLILTVHEINYKKRVAKPARAIFTRKCYDTISCKTKKRSFRVSRASCRLHVITSSYDWSIGLPVHFVVGYSVFNWFWFHGTHSNIALIAAACGIGSITSRSSGKEPALLPRRFFSGRDADRTRESGGNRAYLWKHSQ